MIDTSNNTYLNLHKFTPEANIPVDDLHRIVLGHTEAGRNLYVPQFRHNPDIDMWFHYQDGHGAFATYGLDDAHNRINPSKIKREEKNSKKR